jgi:hypothetical protein
MSIEPFIELGIVHQIESLAWNLLVLLIYFVALAICQGLLKLHLFLVVHYIIVAKQQIFFVAS